MHMNIQCPESGSKHFTHQLYLYFPVPVAELGMKQLIVLEAVIAGFTEQINRMVNVMEIQNKTVSLMSVFQA